MSALYFGGQWEPWAGLFAALSLALGSFVWYRNGLRQTKNSGNLILPALRAGAIFLLVLMLTGPTIRYRKTTGTLTRLLILVDGSQSMQVTDQEMDVVRKLAIARALRWLPSSSAAGDLEKASADLTNAEYILRNLLPHPQVAEDKLRADIDVFFQEIEKVFNGLDQNSISAEDRSQIERELFAPLKKLRSRLNHTSSNLVAVPKEIPGLVEATLRMQTLIAEKARDLAVMDAGGDRKIMGALSHFDQTTRIERIRNYLLDAGEEGLVSHLNSAFDIELLSIENNSTRLIWNSRDGIKKLPPSLPPSDGVSTNLASILLERVEAYQGGASDLTNRRTVVVLFSDGRHNASGSPLAIAKLLGDRGIPLYCIGVGSEIRPADLALVRIDAPQTVFYEDRVSGSVSIKDDMPPGIPFQLKIFIGEKSVWEKSLVTSQRSVIKIPFDFSIKEIVAQKLAEVSSAQASFPLAMEASLSVLPQEREIRNNTGHCVVRATTGKRKLLILDGRPRWETRYIRNLFERDPQWQVNALLGELESNQVWPRGRIRGTFPSDEEALFEYDSIIFGEVPPNFLSDDELQLISKFISIRGGGLLFLDGPRQVLSLYAKGPLMNLFPVAFAGATDLSSNVQASSVRLTDRGAAIPALRLEEGINDPGQVWQTLPAPKHFTHCTALPGTDTLIEFNSANRLFPALVFRRYGAGQVAYMASDESWRWRNEVGGKYQDRFWSQVINNLGEALFSVADEQIALDTDSFNYPPGYSVPLRARIRDGKPRTSLDVTLWRDGKQYAMVHLVQDRDRLDTFSGRTSALETGVYDFGASDTPASPRLRFEVAPPHSGELSDLTLNRELLSQMANASHGAFIPEENTGDLPRLISPLGAGYATESEIHLWQSYGWFSAILFLLTLEWILRKRVGLI